MEKRKGVNSKSPAQVFSYGGRTGLGGENDRFSSYRVKVLEIRIQDPRSAKKSTLNKYLAYAVPCSMCFLSLPSFKFYC